MARSNKVGELRIELTAGIARFVKDLATAEKTVDRFGVKVTASALSAGRAIFGLGAKIYGTSKTIAKAMAVSTLAVTAFTAGTGLAATGVIRSLNQTAEVVDQIGKTSQRLDIPIEQLSALRFAAAQSGVGFEELSTMAAKAMKTVAAEVARGASAMRLGSVEVQLTDINGRIRDTSSLIEDISKAIAAAPGQAERLGLAQRVFGRGGADSFVTLLDEMGPALFRLSKNAESARAVGAIISQDEFERLRDYGDAVDRVGHAWFGLKVRLASQVAPVLTEFFDQVATRMARVPEVMNSIISVSRGLSAGTLRLEDRAGAKSALAELQSAAGDMLVDTARDLGSLMLTAFSEALKFAVRAAAPDIADVFRDAIAPMLNVLPGIEIDPSSRGRLAELQSRLAGAEGPDADRRLQQLREYLAAFSSPNAAAGMGMGAYSDVRGLVQEEITKLEQDAERLRRAIAVQQAVVRQEIEARAQDNAAAAREAMAAVAAEAGRIAEGLASRRDRLDAAADALAGFYRDAAPPPETDQAPPRLDALAAAIEGFWTSVSASAGKAESAGKRLAESFKEVMEFRRELEQRSMLADASGEEGRRIELLSRFAEEEARAAEKFGRNADVMNALRQTQARELARFNRDLQMQGREAEDERRREAQSLLESLVPQERFIEERKRINDFFADGLIKREHADRFRDHLFELEIASDDTFGGKMSQTIWNFRNTFTDSLADMVQAGKYNFGQLADEFERAMLRMALAELVVTPLFQAGLTLGRGLFGGGGTWNPPAGQVGPPVTASGGYSLQGEGLGAAWSGLDWPAGEAPGLERSTGASGGDAMSVVVHVHNQGPAGTDVQVRGERGPGGEQVLRIMILDTLNRAIDDGTFDRRMKARYGVAPVATRR